MAVSSGAGSLANTLLTTLTSGKTFTIPVVNTTGDLFKQPTETSPIYGQIEKVEIGDLTSGEVGGAGVFDQLMVSLVRHLQVEYEQGRISGAEYTKAYIGVIAEALSTANQFLLSRNQSYWQALLVQAQAKAAEVGVTQARLELESVRVMLARAQYEAATAEATYGLTKIKISTEDATYDNLIKQGQGVSYTNTNILPKQVALLNEQVEVQRSQTLDTRLDGGIVKGSVGKQKDLYSQQIDSYKRDAETKAAKIYSDAWITQKTIDEGVLAPNQFTNTHIDSVLSKLRANLQLT